MEPSPRYAIYFAPARESKLASFGSRLLGYDAWSGQDRAFPQFAIAAAPDWPELTADPRKYGFHATLKAPFTLAADKSEAELAAACDVFADTRRSIPVIRPVISAIAGFIALTPEQPGCELQQLAFDCVTAFDGFREALSAEDRARRRPDELTPRQLQYLERWGYPYVAEEFRFHMTLTGRLPEERRQATLNLLRDRFAAISVGTVAIDRIALCRQLDANDRFRILADWTFRPDPA
ncbi:MAG: DUF1045 domain-containing protein [Alphaproteobacteria bacterium]|nr:DUF1045 domain-containing protein [Alphaproteobacteria bacterium]